VFEIIKDLVAQSKSEDPNFEKIDAEQERIFKLAQLLFEEGDYARSLEILTQLEKQDLKEELWLKSTWARLYNEIILSRDSTKTLEALKKKIEDIEKEELAFFAKQKKSVLCDLCSWPSP
jgi:hypothetical protein